MDIEHYDITHAIRTGYPRDVEVNSSIPWSRNIAVYDDAFPYEPSDEGEE